jgi:hypothetical protein
MSSMPAQQWQKSNENLSWAAGLGSDNASGAGGCLKNACMMKCLDCGIVFPFYYFFMSRWMFHLS